MTLAPVDWPLVLKFTEALAGPIVTLVAVLVAARMGVNAYRDQKLLDRRLDWLGAMLARIDAVQSAVTDMTIGARRTSPEQVEATQKLMGVTLDELGAGLYLVDRPLARALTAWTVIVRDIPTVENADRIKDACQALRIELLRELRRELRVPVHRTRWDAIRARLRSKRRAATGTNDEGES